MGTENDSPITHQIYEFLDEFKVDKNSTQYTHTSMGPPYGKYNIMGSDRRSTFMKLYCNAIEAGAKLHLTEVHRSQGPVLIDLDMKYVSENNKRVYNDNHIFRVIKEYNRVLSKYLNFKENCLQAFVFEKPHPTDQKTNLKDGIHIMYPYLCTEPELQYVIRQEVIDVCKEENWFGDMNLINTVEEVFDKAVIKNNNWIMYGSSKPGCPPYKLTKAYYYNMDTIDIDTSYEEYKFPELFSIRRWNSEEMTQFQPGYSKEYMKDKCKELGILTEKTVKKVKSNKNNPDEVRVARKLTELLSIRRAQNYSEWIELGWCLHNINESLLDAWIDFSKKDINKFIPGECEKRWEKFRDDGFSIGSLYKWAKEDNEDGYTQFKLKEMNEKMENGISGTSYDTAKVVYDHFKYTFACTSIKNKTWYEFDNHRWRAVDEGYTLSVKISEEICNLYSKLSSNYGQLSIENKGQDKDMMLAKANTASNITIKLRNTKFKNDVLSECKSLFYSSTFIDRLDENRSLLGFDNGVYDLEHGCFRFGRPEDMISLSTGINYKEYDPTDPVIKEVEKFLNEIQPEADMQNYVLDLLASCLQGHVPDEKFHIWTGTGSNGKSLLLMLFMKAMGDYAATLPTTLLTGKRSASSSANPEMARTKGKRFCVIQEPEEKDKINLGLMKELTGGDRIYARGLFKDPIEFYPQFKLILTCNKLPFIASNDGGTWRRIRLVPFEMKFVDNPKEPFERKIDRSIKAKLDSWKQALMSILINRFATYKKNGLVEPMKVVTFTNKYQSDSDVYLEFINENIELTKNNDETLKLMDIYDTFKSWFKNAHSDKKTPTRNELKNYFEEKYKKMPATGWKGMKWKMEGQEETPDQPLPKSKLAKMLD